MIKIFLFSLLICMSSISFSKMQTYTIINGGGVDDRYLGLKDGKNREIHSYCMDKCGNWFQPSKEHEGENLKSTFKGKKVIAELSYELNKDRIVGPGEDDRLYFIKSIKLLTKP